MRAFPIMFKHPTTGAIIEHQGMDLRDYFAATAMVKLMGTKDISVSCESAYKWADEMLKAREKTNE